jgi:hypothetical protein
MSETRATTPLVLLPGFGKSRDIKAYEGKGRSFGQKRVI